MILAIVPARGGSRRVPNKNLQRLGNDTLVRIACRHGQASKRIQEVIVSTDSAEIIREVEDLDCVRTLRRPIDLAVDEAPMLGVLKHCLDQQETQVDVMVLLQPTSPLRTIYDVDGAIDLYEASGADTVVSVVRVPHQLLPGNLMTLDDGFRLTPAFGKGTLHGPGMSELFIRNGPAIWVSSPESLLKHGLYGPQTLGYEMPQVRSVDINTAEDLIICEALYNRYLNEGDS